MVGGMVSFGANLAVSDLLYGINITKLAPNIHIGYEQ
jgi:hypothetical protein